MQLNTKNKEDYLHYLYEHGLFETMLTYATEEMNEAFSKHSYEVALDYYKYILIAKYNLGQFDHLTQHLAEFKKLCILYGKTNHWIHYYRLYALCQSTEKHYDEAIEAGKRAIHNAFQIKDYKAITICYSMLSTFYFLTGDKQQYDIAMKLAKRYNQSIQNDEHAIIRVNIAFLYVLSQTKQLASFIELRDQTAPLIQKHALHFYQAKLYLFEANLYYSLEQTEQALLNVNQGLAILHEQNNVIYLQYVLELLQKMDSSYELPDIYINHAKYALADCKQNISLNYDTFKKKMDKFMKLNGSHNSLLPLTPLNELGPLVNEQLLQHPLVVVSFLLDEPSAVKTSQLTDAVFSFIVDLLIDYHGICTRKSNNEGIFVLPYTTDIEHLLYKIYQNIRKLTLKNDTDAKRLPIHFGLAYSEKIEQPTFERIYTKSNAALYYAQTNNKLFII